MKRNKEIIDVQSSSDESSSSAHTTTINQSNEITSTEYWDLSPILNLESPTDEMSTIMKKRATQKLNDKEVNSEIAPQDLPPPRMNFAPMNSNFTSPNSESFVFKKTGLSPPTSAEGSITFCYIRKNQETVKKMPFLDEENNETKEAYPSNILENSAVANNETITTNKDSPIMDSGRLKPTHEVSMKEEEDNRLVEQNQYNQSIDKSHDSCQDKNNDNVNKTEKNMIIAMMHRYLDNQNLELDSTEARSFSHNHQQNNNPIYYPVNNLLPEFSTTSVPHNHQQNNDPIYYPVNNLLPEFSTTSVAREFAFRNDVLRNDQGNLYHPAYRTTNSLPEFDVRATEKISIKKNEEVNNHFAYTHVNDEVAGQYSTNISQENQQLHRRLSFENLNQNNHLISNENYEKYQQRSRHDPFQKPQSYAPHNRIINTPDLVECNSPTATNDVASDRVCHCKKSKCLKLYCECFSASLLCNRNCSCHDCLNNEANLETRQRAISSILARNSMAFKNKMSKAEKRVAMLSTSNSESATTTSRGCNCRKSQCLKKYCECFFTNKLCNPIICSCIDCHNFEGSAKLFYANRKKDENERKEYDSGKRREIRYQNSNNNNNIIVQQSEYIQNNNKAEESFCNLEAHFGNKRFKQSSDSDECILETKVMDSSRYDANLNNDIIQSRSKPSLGNESDDVASDPQKSVMV